MLHTGKVYQQDLARDCPQDSSEIDHPGLSFGPSLKISQMCQHPCDFSKMTKTGTTAPVGPMGSHGSNSLK